MESIAEPKSGAGSLAGHADGLVIGVLSDTHGKLDPRAYAALADCDHIIHAGDIGGPSILRELETLAPVTAVLGNNDYDEYGPAVRSGAQPVLGGVRFLVSHYPQDVLLSGGRSRVFAAGDPIPDVCIHGHTHVPRLLMGTDARPATYVLNPGSTFRPRGGNPRSIAKIAIAGGQVQGIGAWSLDGDPLFSVGEAPSF